MRTGWQDFPMTGFTIPPISPPLPCPLAPLAPLDAVLNYLIHDSSPVTLLLLLLAFFFFSFSFFFFYCYNTTLLSYSPPFMAINTQCRGCIKSSQDFGTGVFITIPFSTLRTYKQA